MNTFKELQERLKTAQFKSAVYQHLVNYLEQEFRSVAGAEPKKVIVTDDKVRVPETTIDIVVKEILTGLSYSTNEINQILGLSIGVAAPEAQVPVQPTPQGEVK